MHFEIYIYRGCIRVNMCKKEFVYIYLFLYLSLFISMYISIYLNLFSYICSSINKYISIYFSIYLFLFLSVYLSMFFSNNLPVFPTLLTLFQLVFILSTNPGRLASCERLPIKVTLCHIPNVWTVYIWFQHVFLLHNRLLNSFSLLFHFFLL